MAALARANRKYALVGGLSVSLRAEVRFTRAVDLAVDVSDDAAAEALVRELSAGGFRAVASVEHEERKRLSTVRLMSPEGAKVDLLFASSGIEKEIVASSTLADLPGVGTLPVARAEELLAMKVLSMSDTRLQDRIDAMRLLELSPVLDLEVVRDRLRTITERGYNRHQDLLAKLEDVRKSARQ